MHTRTFFNQIICRQHSVHILFFREKGNNGPNWDQRFLGFAVSVSNKTRRNHRRSACNLISLIAVMRLSGTEWAETNGVWAWEFRGWEKLKKQRRKEDNEPQKEIKAEVGLHEVVRRWCCRRREWKWREKEVKEQEMRGTLWRGEGWTRLLILIQSVRK